MARRKLYSAVDPCGRIELFLSSNGASRVKRNSASVFTTYSLPKDTFVTRLREDVHQRGLESARESLRTRRASKSSDE
jgi:hypothetical protein